MIRKIYRDYREAVAEASKFLIPGYHSIEWKNAIPGAQKAAPCGDHQDLLFYYIRKGRIPSDIPGFLVIDGDGKPVAACYYFDKSQSDKTRNKQ